MKRFNLWKGIDRLFGYNGVEAREVVWNADAPVSVEPAAA